MSDTEGQLAQAIVWVGQLKKSVEELSSNVQINRRNTRWLFASVVFDIVLSFALAYGGYFLNEFQHDQQEITQVTRNGQCAFAGLFLDFEKNSINNPTLTPEEKQKRIDAYKKIRGIYDSLECSKQG